jgi:hypothetical protein
MAMKPKKIFKYKKGDIVYCSAFVQTKYEKDIRFLGPLPDGINIIHIPENECKNKKVLVRSEVSKEWSYPSLVVAIKQIQTGYYYPGSPPSGGWYGDNEGEQAEFYADKYHDVYVLESLYSQRWSKLDYALEEDLRSEK